MTPVWGRPRTDTPRELRQSQGTMHHTIAVLVLALVGASDALRVGTLGRRTVVQQSVAAAAVSIVFPTGSAYAVQEASKEA